MYAWLQKNLTNWKTLEFPYSLICHSDIEKFYDTFLCNGELFLFVFFFSKKLNSTFLYSLTKMCSFDKTKHKKENLKL